MGTEIAKVDAVRRGGRKSRMWTRIADGDGAGEPYTWAMTDTSATTHSLDETAARALTQDVVAALPKVVLHDHLCLLYTSPSPRDVEESRMPSSA